MHEPTQNDLGQLVGRSIASLSVERAGLVAPMVGVHCGLEPLAESHASDLYGAYAAADDDGDWTYLPYGPFEDDAAFRSWLVSNTDSIDPLFFAIVSTATGRATGIASYLRIDDYAGSIEVGHIHLSRELQSTIAATEAMHLMMQRAFSCGYRRYEWKCDDLNAPSRRAATRLGFQYEGTFRQATHYKGRNRDTAWFAVIDADWPALDSEFQRWLAPANFGDDGVQRSPLRH